ncbi:methyltransferase domain-containing protein [uncultured Porticoccus sp.]|uniref:class I SAM-dependent methyltransferase n=1 Tax=uncultured Porticoccus sp. TaxID=1256050 RepID=UPI002613825D|nr:methyltransferase domain-containing protein [uncultured Porticoccus sp.]
MKRYNWLLSAREFLEQRHVVRPLADSQGSLDSWFQSRYGQVLLHRERSMLEHMMPGSGAHRLMYLGASSNRLLTGDFNHLQSFSMGASAALPGSASAIADFDALPLPSETIDTVLLHHALEFSAYPHEVLNEVARVLTPCGHVVIVVMNPLSLFGLSKWVARYFSSRAIWSYHSLRYSRLLDWLRLLNLQPIQAVSGCFGWPLQHPATLDRTGFLETIGQKSKLPWGTFYIVVARKYTARLTPVKPGLWRSISIPVMPVTKKNGAMKKPFDGDQ